MKLSNKTYDLLKLLLCAVIPEVTTFYCVLDKVFHWGYIAIVATISAALCACIGNIINFSTAQHNRAMAVDNEDCYVQMVKESNQLQEEINLMRHFDDFEGDGE